MQDDQSTEVRILLSSITQPLNRVCQSIISIAFFLIYCTQTLAYYAWRTPIRATRRSCSASRPIHMARVWLRVVSQCTMRSQQCSRIWILWVCFYTESSRVFIYWWGILHQYKLTYDVFVIDSKAMSLVIFLEPQTKGKTLLGGFVPLEPL